MKKILYTFILLTSFFVGSAQTTYTWNGSVSSSWTNNSNWSPSSGSPTATDHVVIVSGSNIPTLSANANITNFTITSGTLDLGGFTLTTAGTNTFTAGTVQNGTLAATAGGNTTFTNTIFASSCTLNMTLSLIVINGGTFNGSTTLVQNGTSTSTGTGNATFNGTTLLRCDNSGQWRTNGNMTFNGPVTIEEKGTGYILFELTTGSTYNANVTCRVTTGATGNVRMSYNGNTTYNGNIQLENTGTGNIYFGEQTTATSTLNNPFTIGVGSGGFSSGRFYLYRFTQLGTTAQTITCTGTSYVIFGASNVFNGNLTLNTIDFTTTNCTYNGNFTWTKTGGSSNSSAGGNTFNGTTTFNNTSSGYQMMGNGSPDIYNGTVMTNNTGTERIILAYNSLGNQFNNNIVVSQSGTGSGTYLGFPGTTTSATLASSKTISIGGGGYTNGPLSFAGFTQAGATAQTITTTANSSVLFEGNNTLNATWNITAPDIYVRGATFNAPVAFTKTGGTGNHNSGALNTFNGTCTINNQSSTGYFMLGYNSNDQFNDNIIVSSTANGGIALGWTGGTSNPRLAAGKTILIGSSGYTAGYLRLGGFTQFGTAPINLTQTGTASIEFDYTSTNCILGGDVSITSPSIYVSGATFNSNATFTKTGSSSDHNNGFQNIFNGTCTINQQGTGYFMLGYNSNDLFNGNIIVSSTNSGGINLGWSSGTGTPTLAATKTVSIGSAGFSSGYLRFGGFTQLGSAPINLTLTGTAYITIDRVVSNCVFGGAFTVTAPDIYPHGGTFNTAAEFTKTGGVNNTNSSVQNIFNGTCTINQQSNTGYFMLGNNANDLFNDNITLTSTGTGGILFGHGSSTGNPTLAATKTIFIGGAGFSAGYLSFYNFTQLGNAPINLTLTGTTTYLLFDNGSSFGGDFTATSPSVYFNGAIFNGTNAFTKTGSADNSSSGGNTFVGVTTFLNPSAGYLLLGGTDADTWNNDVTFSNTGSARILPCWTAAGNMFNGNITVNSTGSSTGIQFCGNTTATATLAATKTIAVGGLGFTSGYLILTRFTQLGSAAVNLPLSSTANYLQYGPTSTFGGSVTSTSPGLYFNSTTFNGVGNFTKTGSTSDASTGGNIFNATSTFINTGSGYLLLGNTAADTWNDDATFTNTGSSRILPCWNTSGNMFNGNIYVNSTGTSAGIHFCGSSTTANATLAATKTIAVGGSGFTSGYLILTRFTQLGNAPVTLNLSATSNYLQYGPTSSFGGNVTSSSPGLFFNGCTFNGTGTFTKTGAANDASVGGNTFNDISTFNNTGTGYLMLGNVSPDIWNNDVTFSNTGSARILPCWTAAGNMFNGNIMVNSTGSSTGINFCGNTTATATLAATKTIGIGSLGFTSGYLVLPRFTQLGSAVVTLNLSAGSNYIQYGPSSSFGGNVTSTSPGLYFNGCTFNGTGTFTKFGASSDASLGGNIFNGTSIFTNSGTGYLMFGNGNLDQFNGTSTFNNTGTNYIYVAHNSTGNTFNDVTFNNAISSGATYIAVANNGIATQFNGNITVNNTMGGGVYFCQAGGNATLANTKTMAVGAPGFTAGVLYLRNLTQVGTAPQTLTLTGSSTLHFNTGNTFNGNVTSSSPSVFFNGSTFNGVNAFTKTGSTNDGSIGGNIFNGNSTFNNTGTGYLLLSNTTADDYNGNVSFVKTNSGPVYPNYNANSTYAGNVSTLGSNAVITFGSSSSGRMTIDGNTTQQFDGPTAFPPTVTRLTMNTTGNISLNVDVNSTVDIAFNTGFINPTAATSTSTGLLILANGITFSNAPDDGSHVTGYVRKIGNAAFTFPTGDGTYYKPIGISAPSNVAHHFTTKFFAVNPDPTYNTLLKDATLNNIDNCEYWILDRTNGTSNIQVTLSWINSSTVPMCQVGNLTDLRVARWNGSMWKDHSNTATTGTIAMGTVTSNTVTSFSPFALASVSALNPLPIELLAFNAVAQDNKQVNITWSTATETNNDFFTIEKSVDGINFVTLTTVDGAGNSVQELKYETIDYTPFNGTSYYRLKQTDFDGQTKTFDMVPVTIETIGVAIYPNPANEILNLVANASFGNINNIVVHDLAGRIVMQVAVNNPDNYKLDVHNLPPSTYSITILGSANSTSLKFIKQ